MALTPESISFQKFILKHINTPETVIYEGSVPTGFEQSAKSEIIEKLNIHGSKTISTQGHVYFVAHLNHYEEIKQLRSLDNISLVAQFHPQMSFVNNEEEDCAKIKKIAETEDLLEHVEKWATLMNYDGLIVITQEEHDQYKKIQKNEDINYESEKVPEKLLKYRVTCERSMKHSFKSPTAQRIYGGILNDVYHWIVNLVNFDINIFLKIYGDTILITLKLTKISLHHRCIHHFGPTSLRPTVAYNMLRYCYIKSGDVIIDPLCGGGSIPIEAAYGFPDTLVICGDIHELAVARCIANIDMMDINYTKPQVFSWDAGKLPFESDSVDVICTDLPFGKRLSCDVRWLYAKILKEFSRVIKYAGRICLLVHKYHNIIAALPRHMMVERNLKTNLGGMNCYVMIIRRRLDIE